MEGKLPRCFGFCLASPHSLKKSPSLKTRGPTPCGLVIRRFQLGKSTNVKPSTGSPDKKGACVPFFFWGGEGLVVHWCTTKGWVFIGPLFLWMFFFLNLKPFLGIPMKRRDDYWDEILTLWWNAGPNDFNIVIQKAHKGNVLMIFKNKHRIPGFVWLEMLIPKVEKSWGSYNLIVMVVSWCGDRKKSDGVEESKSYLLQFWILLRDMRFWLTGNSFDSCGSSSGGRKGWNLSRWFSKNPRIL